MELKNIERMDILLFGKSRAVNVEYFLNKLSGDEQEESSSKFLITPEICRKIQRSCEADVS